MTNEIFYEIIMKGIGDHAFATREDIVKLQVLGWREFDIVDAVQHGFGMYAPGKMPELFPMI